MQFSKDTLKYIIINWKLDYDLQVRQEMMETYRLFKSQYAKRDLAKAVPHMSVEMSKIAHQSFNHGEISSEPAGNQSAVPQGAAAYTNAVFTDIQSKDDTTKQASPKERSDKQEKKGNPEPTGGKPDKYDRTVDEVNEAGMYDGRANDIRQEDQYLRDNRKGEYDRRDQERYDRRGYDSGGYDNRGYDREVDDNRMGPDRSRPYDNRSRPYDNRGYDRDRVGYSRYEGSRDRSDYNKNNRYSEEIEVDYMDIDDTDYLGYTNTGYFDSHPL